MLNKFKQLILIMGAVSTIANASDPWEEFEEHRETYHQGRFERDPTVISEVLLGHSNHKILQEKNVIPRALTASEAFEAEIGKAYDPIAYIPFAVLKGTSYGEEITSQGWKKFHRLSVQRDFRNPSDLVYVHELVTIDQKNQRILFLGKPFTKEDMTLLGQYKDLPLDPNVPLFDVEHSIKISEKEQVFDSWRMVRHVTPESEAPSIMDTLKERMRDPETRIQSILYIYGEYLRQKIL